jgi:hypothetical protein
MRRATEDTIRLHRLSSVWELGKVQAVRGRKTDLDGGTINEDFIQLYLYLSI